MSWCVHYNSSKYILAKTHGSRPVQRTLLLRRRVHILFIGITVEKIFGAVTLLSVSPRPVILLFRSVDLNYTQFHPQLCAVCVVYQHFIFLCSYCARSPKHFTKKNISNCSVKSSCVQLTTCYLDRDWSTQLFELICRNHPKATSVNRKVHAKFPFFTFLV